LSDSQFLHLEGAYGFTSAPRPHDALRPGHRAAPSRGSGFVPWP
jgi:hypothetical protein